MKRYHLILILLTILSAIILISYNTKKPDNSTAKIKTTPQRIVSMAPNLTEILFALGLDEKIVAVTKNCDYPLHAADNRQTISYWNPNTETIIGVKPDMVIGLTFPQHENVTNTLKRLDLDVLTLNFDKIDDLFTMTEKIGAATNCSQKAAQLNSTMKNQIESLRSKLSSTPKIETLWVIQQEPLRVAGRDTFVNELLQLAGGENAIGQTLQQYPPIAAEQLLTSQAQVIIQSAMGKTNMADQQKNAEAFWKKYPNIPAVKNNRIYVVDSDIVLRLGPRLPKGIEMIASCLHPDIFEN